MEKTTTISLRVSPSVKKNAEEVLSQLGISMSTAIDMYLRQIAMTGRIPFDVALPDSGPPELEVSNMTKEEFWAQIHKSIEDFENGKGIPFDEAMKRIEEKFGLEKI